MIIKWIESDKNSVMEINLKIIYWLNMFYKMTQIWFECDYTLFKLVKKMLSSNHVNESYQILSPLYKTISNTLVETF